MKYGAGDAERRKVMMAQGISRLLVSFLYMAVLLSGTSCSGREEKGSETLFHEGMELVERGKYDEAVRKYEQGLKQDPQNHVGYNLLGMAYRFQFNELGAQKYKDREIEAFKKAIELEEDYWIAYKNLAATLYYQGRKKEALPYIEKALELQPNDPERELLLRWIAEGKKP